MRNKIKVTCALCDTALEREKRQMNGNLVFCSRSHSAMFYAPLKYNLDHGNYGLYRKGCRCDLCKRANSERMQKYWTNKTIKKHSITYVE
jgi:hypothetical protein